MVLEVDDSYFCLIPLVHCKDCEYCKRVEFYGNKFGFCELLKGCDYSLVEDCDFCSRGVRKEDCE